MNTVEKIKEVRNKIAKCYQFTSKDIQQELDEIVAELEAEPVCIGNARDDAYRDMLMIRHINNPCKRCQGYGVHTYASTATWRGGIGGQAITSDICDACWGSGDADKKWLDLRNVKSKVKCLECGTIMEAFVCKGQTSCGKECDCQKPVCETCGGSGVMDSGGQNPDGSWINIPCPDCQKQEDKVAALEIRQLIIDLAFHSQKPNPATIFKKLDVLIDRQAKEIEQWELTNNALRKRNDKLQGKVNVLLFEYELLKQQMPMEQISDLQKENASLKEALEKIVKFDLCADCEDDCYNCDKYSALAKQALKGK